MLAIQVVAHVGQLRLLGALMRAAADSGVEVSRARAAWSRGDAEGDQARPNNYQSTFGSGWLEIYQTCGSRIE